MRMGVDKASVSIDGTPLLSRVFSNLQTVTPNITAIGPRRPLAGFEDLRWVPDRIGFMDPMGAILTAFQHLSAEHIFVVALDMPALHPPLVRYLCELALNNASVDLVAPIVDEHGFEPLCAVYSRRVVARFEQLHSRGERSLRASGAFLQTRLVPLAELEEQGVWAEHALANLNTVEDVRNYQKLSSY